MRMLNTCNAADLVFDNKKKNAKLDKNEVKFAASGRWTEIIRSVTGIGDEYLLTDHGPCPKCGGNDRFRCYDDFDETGGMQCNQCGIFADGLAAIGWLNGIGFGESLAATADYIGIENLQNKSYEKSIPQKKRKPKSPINDDIADLRHRVYSRLGELCGISDIHRNQLRQRGLTDDEIDYRGYFSVGRSSGIAKTKLHNVFSEIKDDVARNVPGVFPGKECSINARNCLMIPVRDSEGRIIAIQKRPDRIGGPKYVWLTSSGKKNKSEFFPSPGAPCHVALPALSNADHTASAIRLTEGPLKADVATSLSGLRTIGVAGVNQWKAAIDFIESLTSECLRISFDADASQNQAVARCVVDAFDYFSRNESSVVVSVENWNVITSNDGSLTHKGIDDALLAETPIRVLCDEEASHYVNTLRNVAKPPPLRNYVFEDIEEPDGRGGVVEKTIKAPLSIRQIAAEFGNQHDSWPKASAGQLFVHDHETDSVVYLNSPSKLLAFARRDKSVDWANGESLLTKSEFYEGLPSCVDNFTDISRYPHFPPLPGRYYTCEIPQPGDGESLEKLLDHYSPNEFDIDRELMKAFIVTLFWGGPPGSRPGWLITSKRGTGQGKSTFVSSIASLVGGAYEFSSDTTDEKIRTGLLTPDENGRRVALLDNVKTGRLSNSSVESLITSPTIGGHRLHAGFASRENSLTWAITMNGAALSRDMAERCVNIQLGKPSHSGGWEESLRSFIEANKQRVIADIARFFSQPTKKLDKYSRWGQWERDVLSRLEQPEALQLAILERSKTANADSEEAETILEYFYDKIALAVGIDTRTPKTQVNLSARIIHIPISIAAFWASEALGEKMKGHAFGKMIDRLNGAGGLPNLKRNPCRTNGRGILWVGDAANDEKVDYDTIRRHYEF